jgi:hypothetical protein
LHPSLWVNCMKVSIFFFLFFFGAIYGQTLVTSCTYEYFLFPCSFSWSIILPHIKYLSFFIRYTISQNSYNDMMLACLHPSSICETSR